MNISSIMSSLYTKTAQVRRLLGTAVLASSTALSGCAVSFTRHVGEHLMEPSQTIMMKASMPVIHVNPHAGSVPVIINTSPNVMMIERAGVSPNGMPYMNRSTVIMPTTPNYYMTPRYYHPYGNRWGW